MATAVWLSFIARDVLGLIHKVKGFEQRTLEREEAEARFRALLEAAPGAMVVVNQTGDIELVKAQVESFFGYRRKELLEQNIEILIPERFKSQHSEHRINCALEPRVRPMGAGHELYGLHKDGREFPAEVSLGPLQTEQGVLVSAAVRDIAQRKQIEDEIRALNGQLARRNEEVRVGNGATHRSKA